MSRTTASTYDSFVAEYYDYLPPVAGRKDLEFYLDFSRRQRGPVLELGCGTGRILLPIARAGHCVTGLDLAAAMLARLRAKLEQEPAKVRERVRLVHGDMTSFDLSETFKLVLLPFRSFQHLLTVEQQLGCLRSVHQHLAPGGILIFDLFQTDPRRMHDPAFQQEAAPFPEVALPDGRRVQLAERIRAFHLSEQQNEVELIYYVTLPDSQTERLVFAFSLRYFFRYEVEHLLARAGYRLAELFGGFDRSPLRDDSPDMIFVAEKA